MSTVAAAVPAARAVSGPPPLPLAAGYFGSALSFLLAAAVGLVAVTPALVAGRLLEPPTVAVTHLFTLGWITLSMLAALQHFVPIALHVPLMSVRTAWLQLLAFDVGLLLFITGLLAGAAALTAAGAVLLATALAAFALCLARAALQVRPATRTAHALLAASAFLLATLGLGALLAANIAVPLLGPRRADLLALHAHVALAGWVLLVLVAVAQRLLPMFLLAHAPNPRLGSASLALIAAGAGALLLFHASPALLRVWLPLALVSAGVAIFLAQVARAFARHGTPELDAGMRLAAVGLVFLAIALVLAPFALQLGWAGPQRMALYLGTTIACALVLFVSGHYYRILPFLVWTHRYAPVGAGPVTGPNRLYGRDTAILAVACYALGAGVLLAGIGRGHADTAQFGAVLLAMGVALLAAQMLGVLRSRPSRGGAAAR